MLLLSEAGSRSGLFSIDCEESNSEMLLFLCEPVGTVVTSGSPRDEIALLRRMLSSSIAFSFSSCLRKIGSKVANVQLPLWVLKSGRFITAVHPIDFPGHSTLASGHMEL